MSDEPPSAEAPAFATRRSTDEEISCAIDLGWRLAELYGLRAAELPTEAAEGLLPARGRLPAGQRLQVELYAAAGDAERVGAPIDQKRLEELLEMAEKAGASPADDEEAFRQGLAAWHVDLEKFLWAKHEARGKAYELGNSLSDTWNRVVRALREPAEAAGADGDAKTRVIGELRTVFTEERTERMKVLLDELQARIDPAAVRIVQRHLDSWRARVELCLPVEGKVVADTLEPSQKGLEPLRRQALIWRQLLSGDKEPEAYLGRGQRTRLRGALARRIWEDYRRRHWRRVLLVACGVAVAAAFFVWLVSWYGDHKALATVIVGFVGSVAGAVGLSTASVTAALRKSVTSWSELMWNTTLTDLIYSETISVGELLPAPDELAQGNRSQLANAVTQGRFHVRRAPEPQP